MNEEHNFHISVKYGLTPQLCEFEWQAIMTFTDFNNEKQFIESVRAFYNHIKKELKNEENSTHS